MYKYRAKITRVIDGDTVEAKVDLGFSISVDLTLRLYGIDCPEIRTKNLQEKAKGYESKEFLEVYLGSINNDVVVMTFKDKQGKFGRYLAALFSLPEDGNVNINQLLVEKGYAENEISS